MDKAKKILELSQQESDTVSGVPEPELRIGKVSMYDNFSTRGIRLDRIEPTGLVVCTFKVPPRLLDRDGNLATGAIANLVDIVGAAPVYAWGVPINVTIDMSISFMSTAKLDDELEITTRLLGKKGGYSGTIVIMKNKATGEIISEARLSLLRSHTGVIAKI